MKGWFITKNVFFKIIQVVAMRASAGDRVTGSSIYTAFSLHLYMSSVR